MDLVSHLRGKDTRTIAPGHGIAQLSAFLPQVQAGKHHQRAELSCDKNKSSARRKDAVLTTRIFVVGTVSFLLNQLYSKGVFYVRTYNHVSP